MEDELRGLLRDWLPQQRWFAGKGRELTDVGIARLTELQDAGAARILHALVTVDYGDPHGPAQDTYQLLLSLRRDVAEGYHGFLLGDCSEGLVYDGLHDPLGAAALLRGLKDGQAVGNLRMIATTELEELPGLAVGVEQSNTSIIYGDAYILKVFRRLHAGINPDLELTRALAEAGSPHVATPLGWIEGDLPGPDGSGSTFALLQTFLRGGTEGWKLAVASVRDLYAELDLHPDEVGGDFAAESERLGTATAEVHTMLARVLESRTATAEESRASAEQMRERLTAAVAIVPDLAPYEAALRAAYDELAQLDQPVPIQRVHGDFHLGQVMRTDSGWALLDFEGEPVRPLSERTALMSPLRDVAGMLRSFDYAARSLLMERPQSSATPALNVRAEEWADRNRAAFCEGYTAGGGADPRDQSALLRAFELDKAVYEVVYEARHRPTWLTIPLGAVARLAD